MNVQVNSIRHLKMWFNSIEEYFEQFPDDIQEIDVSIQTPYLPDLSRFYNLTVLRCDKNQLTQLPDLPSTLTDLYCSYNQLTQLPPLPSTLQYLVCYKNQLTQLPDLPSTLQHLYCGYNQLTQLPPLPSTLTELYCNNNQLTLLPTLPSTLQYLVCYKNQLTQLPALPSTLLHLDCRNNLLPFDHDIHDQPFDATNKMKYIIEITNKNNIIIRFKELFYVLKYKKRIRDWLWVRIREPKIRNKYHPDKLIKLLEDRENLTLDELDELDDNW
jgi:Leucine-rich repeat (LRR) protein